MSRRCQPTLGSTLRHNVKASVKPSRQIISARHVKATRSQSVYSESGHCPLLLSEGPGPCTFTGSELGWSTLGVRVHWLKSADAALALSADEALPHSQCQWPHWLVRWFGGQQHCRRPTRSSRHSACPSNGYPDYWATAVEYKERHLFERHQKGWGTAHTTPAPASVPFIAASHPFTGRRSSC